MLTFLDNIWGTNDNTEGIEPLQPISASTAFNNSNQTLASNYSAPKSNANNSSMWGGIAGAAANIFQTATTTLNPKVRENQLAIAEANAAAAQANAQASTVNAFDPKIIIFGVIVIVLIIALMMRSKK